MPTYDNEQLNQYFEHIHCPESEHAREPLAFLTQLQKHQLTRVPFESLSLHYSVDKSISLDPQRLFEKIVVRNRGGYCLENNTFFGAILRSLGFQVTSVICRISFATRGIYDGSWRGMSHMANIVNLNDSKYLVDVGYGVDGPCFPLPLIADGLYEGLPGQELRLEYKKLKQHHDPNQHVWIYSQRRGSNWDEIYNFVDVEFFPADFEVLNFYNMTQSLFARTIVVQLFVFDSERTNIVGTNLLVRDTVKSRIGRDEEDIEILNDEEQRTEALERVFQIKLTGSRTSSY